MKNLPRARCPKEAFTLIEMLVVLAIIGILAAFALCAVWRRVLARADRPISHQAASS